MAERRIGEREPIVETFLERNEEISDMEDRKRRRYGQLMARFKSDTLTWTLSQRRRFCGHANSLLRSLKKPERLELHYSGNKMNFRVGLVDVRGRRNVLQEENVYVQNQNELGDNWDQENENRADNIEIEDDDNGNEAGDNQNQDNEILGRQGDKRRVKRVYRHTARQKRGRRPAGETSELSELRVEIKNKDRTIRKKNLEIRSEKRNLYTVIPDFRKFAKMIITMKLVFTELPLKSKPMKFIELDTEADNGVKNLLGVHADAPLGDGPEVIDDIVQIFLSRMNHLLLNHEDDEVFLSSRDDAEVSFSQQLEKLLTDLEQLRTEKEALENRLKEIVQN